MQVCFSGKTADEAWQQAADAFRSGEGVIDETSRGGATHELLQVAFKIEDPRQRWVASRVPAMNPAFGLAEVIWIMAGRNDSAFLNYWNPILPKYAGDGETYDGAYGHRLRQRLGLDQFERAYRSLRSNPGTRQVVLQIWDATSDLPKEDGLPSSADIPCNIVSLLKVRGGKLYWTQIIRSNDLFLGVPHNFVQFMTLQEIMSGWLGLEPGPYVQWSDSLHVYEDRLSSLGIANLSQPVTNTDNLALPKEIFDQSLSTLSSQLNGMLSNAMSASDVRKWAKADDLPRPYQNMLSILSADAARRFGDLAAADEIAAECNNPLLTQLWMRWRSRQIELATQIP
jgi:thymidylate synthase